MYKYYKDGKRVNFNDDYCAAVNELGRTANSLEVYDDVGLLVKLSSPNNTPFKLVSTRSNSSDFIGDVYELIMSIVGYCTSSPKYCSLYIDFSYVGYIKISAYNIGDLICNIFIHKATGTVRYSGYFSDIAIPKKLTDKLITVYVGRFEYNISKLVVNRDITACGELVCVDTNNDSKYYRLGDTFYCFTDNVFWG